MMLCTLPVFCNVCCQDMNHPPWNDDELKILSVKDWQIYWKAINEIKPCPYLRKGCSIHHRKPKVCRDFKVGSEYCLKVRKKYGY
jgi:Fe-S-cluster containining protein